MRHVLGVMLALAVGVGQGCSASPTASQPQTQCAAGQHVLGTSCAWDTVTITIGPGLDAYQVANASPGAAAGCFVFSANPTSVHTNQLVQWVNNSTATITIFQSPATPLTTVGPGQTSGGVYWASAGTVTYRPSTCAAGGVLPYYGVVTITVN
jgi:hypothetical protein